MSGNNLVTLRADLDPTEAHILKARLAAEGIEAHLLGEQHVQADWTVSLALGGVRLQVRQRDLDAAGHVMAALDRGEYMLSETDVPTD